MTFKLLHKPSPSSPSSPSKRANRLLNQLTSPVVPHHHPIEVAAEAIEHAPSTEVPAGFGQVSRSSFATPILEGAGAALPEATHTMLEASGVPPRTTEAIRVHTGMEAGRLARSLGARAATWGYDIAFAPGEYHPQHEQGMRLLRHEAFHASLGLPAFSLRRDPARLLEAVHVGEQVSDAELRSLDPADLVWLRNMLRLQPRLDVLLVINRIDNILHGGSTLGTDVGTSNPDDVLPASETETEEERIERKKRETIGKTGREAIAVWEQNDVGAEQLTPIALGLIKFFPEVADLDKKLKDKERADMEVAHDEAELAAFESTEAWRLLTEVEEAKATHAQAKAARKGAGGRLKQLERDQLRAGMSLRGDEREKTMAEYNDDIAAQTNEVSGARGTEEELDRQVEQLERQLAKHTASVKQINKIRGRLRVNRIQAARAAEAAANARARAEKRIGPALEKKVVQLRRERDRARKRGDADAIQQAEAEYLKYDFEAALHVVQKNGYRLTEPAKQIHAEGPAGSMKLRRERAGKEGTVRQRGTLEFNDDDILRGIALAGGHGPMVEIDPAFAEATQIPEEFRTIFRLFVNSEGKADSFFTDSAGGWTLATGFTGTVLAKRMAAFQSDDPEGYQRLFGQYGVDVTAEGRVSYSIPENDYEVTVADRAGGGKEMPMQMQNAPASEAFSALRRDPKFLYMMATSTRDPIFRAEFTKYFWSAFENAKAASLEFNGSSITWGSLGSRANSEAEFQAVWLLPFIHGAISGKGAKNAIERAEELLAKHPELDSVAKAYAPAWWAASFDLRHTSGKRWSSISTDYGTRPWFGELTWKGLAERYGHA